MLDDARLEKVPRNHALQGMIEKNSQKIKSIL